MLASPVAVRTRPMFWLGNRAAGACVLEFGAFFVRSRKALSARMHVNTALWHFFGRMLAARQLPSRISIFGRADGVTRGSQ